MKRIALLGEYDPGRETQLATIQSIIHSSNATEIAVSSEWVSTAEITSDLFTRYHGFWVAPGTKYHDQEKLLWAIQFSRRQRIPCISTCGGFQQTILEYARNELGVANAQSEEYDPGTSYPFISSLPCSLRGRTMKLTFSSGSLVERLYGNPHAEERYFCGFGVNPTVADQIHSGGMRISGSDTEGTIRVIEWPAHPFFVGTLYVPQAGSTPDNPHPLVSGFLRAL